MGALPGEVTEQIRDEQFHLTSRALERIQVTPDSLARLLKAELSATETKFIKVKGMVYSRDEWTAPAEESATKETEAKGKKTARFREVVEEKKQTVQRPVSVPFRVVCAGKDESIIAVEVKSLSIMQNARMDAMKALGMYPKGNGGAFEGAHFILYVSEAIRKPAPQKTLRPETPLQKALRPAAAAKKKAPRKRGAR